MLRLIFSCCLGAALLATTSCSHKPQSSTPGTRPPGTPPGRPSSPRLFGATPVADLNQAYFAYAHTHQGSVEIRRAKFVSLFPEIIARQLETIDTITPGGATTDSLNALEASPDNAFVLYYVFQESRPESSDQFVDHNLVVHSLRTGRSSGQVNEHTGYESLSKAAYPSLRFAEFLAQRRLDGEEPAQLAGYDYFVEVNTGDVRPPRWQWNADRTLSVTFTLYVACYVATEGTAPAPIHFALEDFTRTYRVEEGALTFLDWRSDRAPATPPAHFLLEPVATNPERWIRFESALVRFNSDGRLRAPFGKPQQALRVTGAIPRRFE